MRDKSKTNHHIIPKSHRDEFDVQHKENQEDIRNSLHEAFHRVFVNLLPHQQIEFLLEFNKAVLSTRVRLEILQILDQDYEKLYKHKFLKSSTYE